MKELCLVKLLFYEQFGWILECDNCAMECDRRDVEKDGNGRVDG